MKQINMKFMIIAMIAMLILGIKVISNGDNNISISFIIGIIIVLSICYAVSKIDIKKFMQLHNNNLEFSNYYNGDKGEQKEKKEKHNYALSIFSLGDIERKYAATSSNKNNDDEEFKGYFLCKSTKKVDKYIPVKRLNHDLSWGKYANSGFAKSKNSCCERKFCGQIIDEFGWENLNGGNLIIYSKLEPCLYCYEALNRMKEEGGVNITLYFDEMISEVNFDNEEDIGTEILEKAKQLKKEFHEKYNKK